MVAFQFDMTHTPPNSGGGGGSWPAKGDPGYLVQIVGDEFKPNSKGSGNMLIFELEGMEPDCRGMRAKHRLNLQHEKAETMRMANEELSAICHAIGVISGNDTRALWNRPFRVLCVPNPSEQYPNGTQFQGIRDANGNNPAHAGQGQQAAAPAQQQTAPQQPAQAAPQPFQNPPGGFAPQGQPPAATGWGPQPQQPAPQYQPPAAGPAPAPAAAPAQQWQPQPGQSAGTMPAWVPPAP